MCTCTYSPQNMQAHLRGALVINGVDCAHLRGALVINGVDYAHLRGVCDGIDGIGGTHLRGALITLIVCI